MKKIHTLLLAGLLATTVTGCASTVQAFLPESQAQLDHPPKVSAWTRFWAGLLLSDHAEWRDSNGNWHKYPSDCQWTSPCPEIEVRNEPHGAVPPPRATSE